MAGMKRTRKILALMTMTAIGAGCQKGSMEFSTNSSLDGSNSAVSCKALTPTSLKAESLKLEAPEIAQTGQTVTYKLNDELTCSSNQSVAWSTSGGQKVNQSGSTMTVTYSQPGQYLVSAKLVSTSGLSASASSTGDGSVGISQTTVVVSSSPVISGQQVGIVSQSMSFGLIAPIGMTITSATWNFGDGSAPESDPSGASHIFRTVGLYTISATVQDSNGTTFNLSQQVNVIGTYDGLTCLTEIALVSPYEGVVGEAVPVQAFIPSCMSAYVTSVIWNFGDGTGNVTAPATAHTFTAPGDYLVSAQIISPLNPSGPFVTLTRRVHIVEAAAQPTPTPNPTATPAPTPTPNPLACPAGGETRSIDGANTTETVACGTNGTKTMTYRVRITEECKASGEQLLWTETSRSKELISEGACTGQSCRLPDGSLLADNSSRVLYSTATPAGSCAEVSQTRTCTNGVLGGQSNFNSLTCRSGCGDFGPDGTVKTGVIIGAISSPVTCQFGEAGVTNIYNQVADQTCSNGSISNSNIRQGDIVQAGICPTYSWTPTELWSSCTADCGGQQTRAYECRDSNNQVSSAERCEGAAPTETRVCDGNPAAVRRTETSTETEKAGSSASKCPSNQIGVILSERTVTKTRVFACVNHQVALESESVDPGPWVTEKYCRDYVAGRCAHDVLNTSQARGRYMWMKKCQNEIPAIKEFLAQFENVKTSGGYSISSTTRALYPAFADAAVDKYWIAPKSESAGCQAPANVYVAAVCLSGCATPEMQILAEAEREKKLKYVPFVDALSQNFKYVATLQSNSSMSDKRVQKTSVQQWMTDIVESEHDIVEFEMKSGRVLRVTTNHPVLSEDGTMKAAMDFKVGEHLVELGGRLDQIVDLRNVKYFGKVYNVFVNSNALHKNVIVTNGYLNGTAYFQNEGVKDLNHAIFRQKMVKGVFER